MHDRELLLERLERLAIVLDELMPQCAELVRDAIALLKGQEAVTPYIDIDEAKCPICKVKLTRQELIGDDVLYEDFFDYCPHCGKPILWESR